MKWFSPSSPRVASDTLFVFPCVCRMVSFPASWFVHWPPELFWNLCLFELQYGCCSSRINTYLVLYFSDVILSAALTQTHWPWNGPISMHTCSDVTEEWQMTGGSSPPSSYQSARRANYWRHSWCVYWSTVCLLLLLILVYLFIYLAYWWFLLVFVWH